ncbi:MAG: ral secretion pathway protein [Proteobacteria bacterium]|nr:ral secretion pathway protein [Pseudomonadota bacterium]
MRSAKGFTLLEILVALAILAVTLMAASRAVGLSVTGASQVKLTLLADWVAQNRLAQHRINRDWPGIGTSLGKESQGGVELHWAEEVSGTPHQMFRRVEVRVLDPRDETHELRRLVGYVSRPD